MTTVFMSSCIFTALEALSVGRVRAMTRTVLLPILETRKWLFLILSKLSLMILKAEYVNPPKKPKEEQSFGNFARAGTAESTGT
jgi:hypothetical protein